MNELKPAAEKWVNMIGFDKEWQGQEWQKKEAVRRADYVRAFVSQYSMPTKFCEILGWLIYRIKEFLQGSFPLIFGMSNRDSAKEVISARFFEVALAHQLDPLFKGSQKDILLKQSIDDSQGQWVNTILFHCRIAYEKSEDPAIMESLDQKLEELNLDKFVGDLKQKLIDQELLNYDSVKSSC